MTVAKRPGPGTAVAPRRSEGRNGHLWLAVACVTLIAVFALMPMLASRFQWHPRAPDTAQRPGGDVELRTGTIQLAPTEGALCQKFLFENDSGRYRDLGLSPCQSSGSGSGTASAEQSVGSNERIELIRRGFTRQNQP